MSRWVALFSQTGSEIYEISKRVGRFPDKIITTHSWETANKINPLLTEATKEIYLCSEKPVPAVYRAFFRPDDLITLHGWLRIVPSEICNEFVIYNGHPGLITHYPELKGKDPQKRAFEGKYKRIGCVIHKVIPEVDAGEVEASAETDKFKDMTLEDIIDTLHEMSVELWCGFLKDRI